MTESKLGHFSSICCLISSTLIRPLKFSCKIAYVGDVELSSAVSVIMLPVSKLIICLIGDPAISSIVDLQSFKSGSVICT